MLNRNGVLKLVSYIANMLNTAKNCALKCAEVCVIFIYFQIENQQNTSFDWGVQTFAYDKSLI